MIKWDKIIEIALPIATTVIPAIVDAFRGDDKCSTTVNKVSTVLLPDTTNTPSNAVSINTKPNSNQGKVLPVSNYSTGYDLSAFKRF